jgi:cytochrome c oxidase assembly factor CtaG
MACCILVAMIVGRLRQLLGLGGPDRSGGPRRILLLEVAAVELATAWAIGRGLTARTMTSAGHNVHGPTGSTSHLALMAQLTSLGLVVPMLLARLRPAGEPALRVGARRQLFAATVAASAVMWFWHLPSVHEPVDAHPSLAIVRALSVLVTGFAFWRCVLGTGRRSAPAAARLIAVVLWAQAGALLGLALLLTTDPMPGAHVGLRGLSAVNDQRAAGLLMLIVDLVVTVPLLGALEAQRKVGLSQIRLQMPQAVQQRA